MRTKTITRAYLCVLMLAISIVLLHLPVNVYASEAYTTAEMRSEELVDFASSQVKENDNPAGTQRNENSVFSENEIRALVFEVGFEDYPVSEGDALSDSIRSYFEGSRESGYPYESIPGFYRRSSYGKAEIVLGDIVAVNLSSLRSSYDGQGGGESEKCLIRDVLEAAGERVDLSEYDSDGDGIADLIFFIYAGEDTDRGDIWWSHCSEAEDISKDGIRLERYVFSGQAETPILIHETGHAFGLSDYYGYEDYFTYDICVSDMMSDNAGDHNSLSKYLLGWIDESQVRFVSSSDGDARISFSPLDKEGDGCKIAIIAPENAQTATEFFFAEYISGEGNMSLFDGRRDYPEGFRIFHAFYDDEGRLYINALTKDNTPGADFGVFSEEDEITPFTVPSTGFYEDGEPLRFTGISFTDFVTGDAPSLNVTFTDEKAADAGVTFTKENDKLSNMLELSLTADRPVTLVSGSSGVRLEIEGKVYPLIIKDDAYNATRFYFEYRNLKDSLWADTDYTLVLPEGTFSDKLSGEPVPEIRMTVRTGHFTGFDKINVLDMSEKKHSLRTGLIGLNGSSGYIALENVGRGEAAFKFIRYDKGNIEESDVFTLSLPVAVGNVGDIEAQNLSDGNILLVIRTDSKTLLQRISQEGALLGKCVIIPELADVIECGRLIKGLSVSTRINENADKTGEGEFTGNIWTVDFEGEPYSFPYYYDAYISGGFFAFGEENYVIAGYSASDDIYYMDIYGADDAFVKRIELSEKNPVTFCASGDKLLAVEVAWDDETGDEYLNVSIYDPGSESFVKKRVEAHNIAEMYLSGIKLMPAEWGYTLFYRYSGKAESSLSRVMFLTEELDEISSVSLPGGADFFQDGQRATLVWETGDERSLAWTELLVDNAGRKGDKANETGSDPIGSDSSGSESSGGSEASEGKEGESRGEGDLETANEIKVEAQGETSALLADPVATGVRDMTPVWVLIAAAAAGVAALATGMMLRRR